MPLDTAERQAKLLMPGHGTKEQINGSKQQNSSPRKYITTGREPFGEAGMPDGAAH
jgi:hypothetical protein